MSRVSKVSNSALLVRPVVAGKAIGQAEQTTRNQLSNPKVAGVFPLPVVLVGSKKRKMVKVADVADFVANLGQEVKKGAGTKASRLARAARGTK